MVCAGTVEGVQGIKMQMYAQKKQELVVVMDKRRAHFLPAVNLSLMKHLLNVGKYPMKYSKRQIKCKIKIVFNLL